jgi:site-specific DNA-methyltransferase (adenine-specific)
MKRVKIGSHILFRDDCMKRMAHFPERKIDMILCDLPFGITRNAWDSVLPFDEMWAAYNRISSGPTVLFAAQPFTSALVMSNVKRFKYDLVWRKNKASGHLNAKKVPLRAHESILVFYDKLLTYVPQMTEGHERAHRANRDGANDSSNYGAQVSSTYVGGQTERYPTSVIDWAVVNNDAASRVHPTQKPVGLCQLLIETYTLSRQRVLDNCMGSGTTGVACAKVGRKFVGIERDKAFFEIACDRINEAHKEAMYIAKQKPLF